MAPAGPISGRVVDAKTGGPVRFANVSLWTTAPETEVEADEQGRFTFPDAVPGRHNVNVRRDGYTPGRVPVEIKEGAAAPEVVVRMTPCGAIAGRITDEKGEPAAGVEVVALRYAYGAWQWRPPVTPEAPLKAFTNDLGEFRIPNLWAGSYLLRVSAIRRKAGAYPSFFYPNVLTPEGALPVNVESAQTTGVTMTLRPGAAFRISGTFDRAGDPREVCFGLTPRRYHAATAQVIGYAARFSPDGSFALDGVPPGSYLLGAAACPGGPQLAAIQPIEVAGNIDGLTVTLTPGRTIAGTVKLDGAPLARVRVTLRSPDVLNGYLPTAVSAADGRFQIEGVFADKQIAEVGALPPGVYVQSVRYGESEIEVTLSRDGAAQLTGTTSPFSLVTAFPSDGPLESARAVAADSQGRFLLGALRPGAYRVMAWEGRYDPAMLLVADPALPQMFDANALSVSVRAGMPQSIALTAVTEADVNRARAASGLKPPKDQE
jgi:hypothetical protein